MPPDPNAELPNAEVGALVFPKAEVVVPDGAAALPNGEFSLVVAALPNAELVAVGALLPNAEVVVLFAVLNAELA